MTDGAKTRLFIVPRRGRAAWWSLAVMALLASGGGGGCGSDEKPASSTGTPPDDPPPDPACAPEQTLPSGGCLEAGVPAEACADGFEPDGQQGCTPTLPAEACPLGQLAIPGDTACREVAPCPDAPYGDAPIDADTQFVDGAYSGDDSDGSMARPWRTINEGIDAATAGAVVAIAAGTYEEGIWSQGKSVRLWGRCPAMTVISGKLAQYAAVEISTGDAAELHDLSITGVAWGVYAYDAEAVVLDRVHVHDTGLEGVLAIDDAGPVQITLRRSLVERASDTGVAVEGATLTIEDSVIRDTQDLDGDPGWGVHAFASSVLNVKRSVVGGSFLGIAARRSQATLEGVVVRDTTWAISNAFDAEGGSTLEASGCVVERYGQYGVYNDSSATLTGMVFRDSVQLPGEIIANAIAFNGGSSGGCQGCLVERGVVGLTVRGASATVAGLVVRDTTRLGAVIIQGSTVDIRSSSFERTGGVGVYVASGSSAKVAEVIVRDTAAIEGLYGDGVTASTGNADVSDVRIEGNARCGVSNFAGVVRLGGAVLECNAIDLDGEVVGEAAFSFEEGDGPNTCGCDGEPRACQVVSSSLAAPSIPGITD